MKTSLFISLLLILGNYTLAQKFQRLEIPVETDGRELLNPWAGGLNSPQFSLGDLNEDGKADIYIFDRNSNFQTAFVNEGTAENPIYRYTPQLESIFPKALNFAMLRDFNGDGIMDFFAHSGDDFTSGYKVYRGKFKEGVLQFDRVKFNHIEFDLLTYTDAETGEDRLIFTNKVDFPAIDDIDGDGDLDIVTNQGDSYLYYFKNVALEQGFTTDTLIFELADECWGKFYIDASGAEFTLGEDASTCPEGMVGKRAEKKHGGSTVSTFDMDGDGDKEVFYGDATNPAIICAKNGGTATEAWMTEQDTIFPNYDTPIFIPDFAATFHLDVDGDGVNDLLAAPNLPFNGPDFESAWLYKNTNTNEAPTFELQSKKFLIEDMIDVGTGAHPTFVDYNADGLTDLVVGNHNRWQADLTFKPSLFLYENTGTATAPRFKLVEDDWLNFSRFGNESYAFTPTFGDLDNDGDMDLLVGERFGTLFYTENIAGAGEPFRFGTTQANWQNIKVGQFATPCISDLNKDKKADLLVGERSGNINFFPNQGSSTNPAFHTNPNESPNNDFLGNITTTLTGEVIGSSAPIVLNFENTTYLIAGNEAGQVQLYTVNQNDLSAAFDLNFLKWGNINLGRNASPAIDDLNGDQLLDLAVGNSRGGIGLFTTNLYTNGLLPTAEIADKPNVQLFPNPTAEGLTIQLPSTHFHQTQTTYSIFNSNGQAVISGALQDTQATIELHFLVVGVYFMEIQVKEHRVIRRFVKQ